MKKHCVLFVTGIKNVSFSLLGVMLSKSQCWTPQTTYILQLPFSASSFCWFWEEKGEAHQNFTWGVTPWKALSAFHHFFNGHVGKEQLPCLRSGSSGKGGHCQERESSTIVWALGLLCSSPGCTSTAQSSSASFGTATSLSLKWTTVHSCGYITLIAFPLRVCLQRLWGPPLH